MTTAQAIATASVFIWLGMVLAISSLDVPQLVCDGIVLTPTVGREESWTRT